MTTPLTVPQVYHEFNDWWETPDQRQQSLEAYQGRRTSFVPHLLPEQAMQLSGPETLQILEQRLGPALALALEPAQTDPDQPPASLPEALRSPAADEPDGQWLKTVNMVGVNVRTIDNFWNIIKYVLTLPASQSAIHLLPIWEAGVVGSMYGMSSWQLNPEFYSAELAELRPHLDTLGKQLRAVVNILHAMGKTVGMDVIPHTDRFSEMSLGNPRYFEWLQREGFVIVDHRADLHKKVEASIFAFLQANGPAIPGEPLPTDPEALFDRPEADRLRLLFGRPQDFEGREERRIDLVHHLHQYGYESVPGTMAPPYRGLEVDPGAEAHITDMHGLEWREYRITRPEPMSRVFGPLTRYKLYQRLNNNVDWEIDFEQPRPEVWRYVCDKYYQMQHRYGFDFMRGDMSHVQMRPGGVPDLLDDYYDILGAVKNYVRLEKKVPYFGYFAETFLAPTNVMSYGEEIDHLEASEADTTLGDLQSTVVGSAEFLQKFRIYYDLLKSRACVPNFTVMTADKDDPRFDEFYLKGNEARLFTSLFLTDMPSYMGLGFETRDAHYRPAPNEHYTKLFVFQEREGPKATHGPYVWGKNGALFSNITRLKLYLEQVWPRLQNRPTRWLIHPNPAVERKQVAWTQADASPSHLFVVNFDLEDETSNLALPAIPGVAPTAALTVEFSTHAYVPQADQTLTFNGKHYKISRLFPGEGRVYAFNGA